jgi:hypothetical protein
MVFFGLGKLLHLAEKLGRGSLVEPGFFLKTEKTDGFQNAQGAQGVRVGSVFSRVKRYLNMGLGCQVVYFIRLNLLDNSDQVGGIGQITVMHDEPAVLLMRILIQMIYSVCVK